MLSSSLRVWTRTIAGALGGRDCQLDAESDLVLMLFVVANAERLLAVGDLDRGPRSVVGVFDADELRPKPLADLLGTGEHGSGARSPRTRPGRSSSGSARPMGARWSVRFGEHRSLHAQVDAFAGSRSQVHAGYVDGFDAPKRLRVVEETTERFAPNGRHSGGGIRGAILASTQTRLSQRPGDEGATVSQSNGP